jgi:hypothetical protein
MCVSNLDFPINLHYRKRSRRSVARGAGVVLPDKRKATVYRRLKEMMSELFILNAGFLYAIMVEEKAVFSVDRQHQTRATDYPLRLHFCYLQPCW